LSPYSVFLYRADNSKISRIFAAACSHTMTSAYNVKLVFHCKITGHCTNMAAVWRLLLCSGMLLSVTIHRKSSQSATS